MRIEAEAYSSKSASVVVGACSDTSGGSDIEGAINNDWVAHNIADFGSG